MNSFTKLTKFIPLVSQVRYMTCRTCCKHKHLICFKQWTSHMVMEILTSAMNLKYMCGNTHNQRMNTLTNAKVMILQEINEPILNMAVSKAATLLGAYDVSVTDHLMWEHDYNGSVFSYMADVIFVATSTHMCVQRFAEQSMVPVLCMKSRTHASIQSLATIMAIMEEFGTMKFVNVTYLGPAHQVLNSYLLLCPMLGANIKFKCCCEKCPVSPLLFKASENMTKTSETTVTQCPKRTEVLRDSCVYIAGPTTTNKDKLPEFEMKIDDIRRRTIYNWIFFHTCPRGKEVDDKLFNSTQSRTFKAFENMQYIAAALMANAITGYKF